MYEFVYSVTFPDFAYSVGTVFYVEQIKKTRNVSKIQWNKETNIFEIYSDDRILISVKSDTFVVVHFYKEVL